MDMKKLLSVEGFIEYYCNYCNKVDAFWVNTLCKDPSKEAQQSGKEYADKLSPLQSYIDEMTFVETCYARMCTFSELKEELAKYIESSTEWRAVASLLRKKQSMVEPLMDYLGF